MAYEDFLAAFAVAQGIDSAEELLESHAKRYASQINSRERAQEAIAKLDAKLGLDWDGLRVLDVGCTYGALAIELAKRGAKVVGIDSSTKWLALAEANALGEVEVPFINIDPSIRAARRQLAEHGPFDVVIVQDAFDRVYDTAGLLANLRSLMALGGTLYFKVSNGKATRTVQAESYKKVFGISLLPPDYWPLFVKPPFQIYYRRWEHLAALFKEFGFEDLKLFNANTDTSPEHTHKHIAADLKKIRQHLKLENFEGPGQFKSVRVACKQYFAEVEEDIKALPWDDLFFKYRATSWEGIVQAPQW